VWAQHMPWMRARFGVEGGRVLRSVGYAVRRCGGFYPKMRRHMPPCPCSVRHPVPSVINLNLEAKIGSTHPSPSMWNPSLLPFQIPLLTAIAQPQATATPLSHTHLKMSRVRIWWYTNNVLPSLHRCQQEWIRIGYLRIQILMWLFATFWFKFEYGSYWIYLNTNLIGYKYKMDRFSLSTS
jgi:hypothetical protein